MNFTDSELERYSRQIVLPKVGGVGQRRLKEAKVALVGAGAIGTAALQALAAAGVGAVTIIDPDTIELSNLHRQPIYREEEIGLPKAETAAAFARRLNSTIEITSLVERITASNASTVLNGYGAIIDGTDNFATRLVVNQAAVDNRIPLVSAAAAQFQAQVGLLTGWDENQPCYRCIVGDAFDSEECDTCAELGVLGALTGVAGNLAALLAIGVLVGFQSGVAGKMFVMNAETMGWHPLRMPKMADCKTCGGLRAPAA